MEELRIERRGRAEWLILNRPERRNALSRDLVRALHSAILNAAGASDVRCLVLAGAGPVFCAGADLNEFRQADDPAILAADGELLSRLLETIAHSAKPVIARVHGPALGGGVGLVAAADFAVADSSARFSFSEVRLGLIPAVISPFVVRALGRRQAQAVMLSGRTFEAGEAASLGLIQRVVQPEALDEAVDELVSQLGQGAPGALSSVKQLLERIEGLQPAAAREVTVSMLAERRASVEGQEGMQAFLEKRAPAWADRS